MKNLKIFDNFLEKKDFEFVHNHMMGFKFPWHMGTVYTTKRDIALCDELYNLQFCNWIYKDNSEFGPEYEIIRPIINDPRLKISSLVRVKANCTTRTEKIIEHAWHKDGYFRCNAAIFYVNSNDGYTKFKDGTKVESVANRLITFNTQDTHTGTTCTNERVRCVLNFNYYSATDEDLESLALTDTNSNNYANKIYGV